ncbi:MAG: hypothetical protein RBS40_15515 [Rhodocyclaceae bacterium]|nr:hypothetical protein [Rhodocyclaceae bacterium]
MKNLISILLLLPLVACSSTPSKSELDAEVKRLCAIDGGIKVYETVKLPAEKFDQYGNVRIPSKAKSTDEYYYDSETIYLREGDPTVTRMVTRIVRRSDGKVLGESIRYARGGGDLPGPWHPSSFICPSPTEKPYLEPSIFLKGNSNE